MFVDVFSWHGYHVYRYRDKCSEIRQIDRRIEPQMASSTSLDRAYRTIILAAATRGSDFIGDRRADECQAILAGARVALACLPQMRGGRSGEAAQLAVLLEASEALGEAIELAKDLRQAQRAGYDLDHDERLQKAADIAARVREQQRILAQAKGE